MAETLPLFCDCTPTTRCKIAWDLRDTFAAVRGVGLTYDAHRARQAIVTAYTAHVRALGTLQGYGPGTEAWPCWGDDDHPDPRKETPVCQRP